jgi:hypothetical protein
MAGIDQKTARRYVEGAVAAEQDRGGSETNWPTSWSRWWSSGSARTAPMATVQRGGASGPHRDTIPAWLEDDDLTVLKVHDLLARQGVWTAPQHPGGRNDGVRAY